MKITRIFATVIIALTCAFATSCTKEEVNSNSDYSMWLGSYPIQIENNDTGAKEDATGHVMLELNLRPLESAVTNSIDGLLSANRVIYELQWSSKNTFTLSKTAAGQTIQYYSGTINGDKIFFEFLSCDKVERTVELSRVKTE